MGHPDRISSPENHFPPGLPMVPPALGFLRMGMNQEIRSTPGLKALTALSERPSQPQTSVLARGRQDGERLGPQTLCRPGAHTTAREPPVGHRAPFSLPGRWLPLPRPHPLPRPTCGLREEMSTGVPGPPPTPGSQRLVVIQSAAWRSPDSRAQTGHRLSD